MDKIKQQANTVSQLVFSAETGEAYKKTLGLTWDILRETGILIWLVICLTFVGGEWFYRNSVQLGRNARLWYNSLGEKPEGSEAEAAASTGEALLSSVKSGTTYLLSRARDQLGLPEPEAMPQPSVPQKQPAAPDPALTQPKPTAAESTPAATASTASTVTSASNSSPAQDESEDDEDS
jgi:hypothetical protein